MGNIVSIRTENTNDKAVELALQLLARCESGEVQELLVVMINKDRLVSTAFTDGVPLADAYFGLNMARMRLDKLTEKA